MALCALGCGSPVAPNDAGDGAEDSTPQDAPRSLARRLRVTEVTLTQGVEIALTRGDTVVSPRNAPVVVGRRGLVRLFVEPVAMPSDAPLNVTARMEFTREVGAPPAPAEVSVRVAAASERGVLGTTFDLPLEAASVDATTSISISLRSDDAPGALRWPATGALPLRAQSAGSPLQVRFIPVRYHGALPATEAPQLELYRAALLGLFPIADVRFEVGEPLTVEGDLNSGREWAQALQLLVVRRAADAPPPPTYFVGLISKPDPGITGIAGLAVGPEMNLPEQRAILSLAVNADGTVSRAPTVVAHELAHAMGRLHGPCGDAAGVDPEYPHADGLIGVWGWNASTGRLRDPRDYHDIMTYCSPQWVSDYTYSALFTRISSVNAVGGM